jgi:hypothetical protein
MVRTEGVTHVLRRTVDGCVEITPGVTASISGP